MDVISPELPQFLKLLIALGVVFALMGGLAFVLKKLGLSAERTIKSGDKRRLKLIESLPLDARRRVVILKCDDREHLVVLGHSSETVIDTDIESVDCSEDSKPSS